VLHPNDGSEVMIMIASKVFSLRHAPHAPQVHRSDVPRWVNQQKA
jgi:hypothetical protein